MEKPDLRQRAYKVLVIIIHGLVYPTKERLLHIMLELYTGPILMLRIQEGRLFGKNSGRYQPP